MVLIAHLKAMVCSVRIYSIEHVYIIEAGHEAAACLGRANYKSAASTSIMDSVSKTKKACILAGV